MEDNDDSIMMTVKWLNQTVCVFVCVCIRPITRHPTRVATLSKDSRRVSQDALNLEPICVQLWFDCMRAPVRLAIFKTELLSTMCV